MSRGKPNPETATGTAEASNVLDTTADITYNIAQNGDSNIGVFARELATSTYVEITTPVTTFDTDVTESITGLLPATSYDIVITSDNIGTGNPADESVGLVIGNFITQASGA